MRRYALWKRISLYSIAIFIIPLVALVAIYNHYIGNTLQTRELRRYRQSCENQVKNINKMCLSVRNLAYDAIYASDSMAHMEQALAGREGYRIPLGEALVINSLMLAQDYAKNIMLFTKDGTMFLKAGIAADRDHVDDVFLVSQGKQPIEAWSERRSVTLEYPYEEDMDPCISYYRIITPLKSMEPIGYCRIDIPERSISAVYNMYDGSTTFLMDADGVIQSATSNRIIGSAAASLYGGALEEAIRENGQTGKVVDADGVALYVVSRYVSRLGWTYVSVIPLNRLTYYSRYLAGLLIVLMFSSALIFVAMQTLNSRMITRPLRQLADEMDRVCSRQPDDGVRRIHTSDETQMLRQSFENMRNRIEHMMDRVYAAQIEELNAKIMYMQTQMNPHFLYNTLDSIRFTARLNNDIPTAEQIEALSAIYRSITKSSVYETVEESLAITRKFALIMQNQQDVQVQIHEHVQPDLREQKIPKLMIQPLVENCYQHGFKGLDRDVCNIWISVVEEDGQVVIEVQDDGVGIDDPIALQESLLDATSGRLALKNIHTRVQMYFGKEHGIRIRKRPGGGTIIRVELPNRREVDQLE